MSTSVPLLPNEIARREAGVARLQIRTDPVRVRIGLTGLHTRDRHDLQCAMDCSVRVAESRSDQRMLAELLLVDREALVRDDVVRHFSRHARAGVESFVAGRDADDLIAGSSRHDLLEAFRRAVDATAFACGLIVMPPFQLDVDSPTLHRHKLEQAERGRAEARAAEQVEHLRRAGDLLKQAQALGSGREVLQQISPADRGATLEALLLASAQTERTSLLWAVAGPYLVRIDATTPNLTTELISLPATLGPLRSVQPATIDGQAQLLIGAQSGVMLVDPQSREPRLFRAPSGESQLGFNRVALDTSSGTFWASHKDYGVIVWDVAAGAVLHTHSQFTGARNVQALNNGTVVFSVGAAIYAARDGKSPTPVEPSDSSNIVGLFTDSSRCQVVRESGAIEILDRTSLAKIDVQRRSSGICATASLPWLGSIRLLLSRDDGAVECAGVDDPLVTQYLSAHHGYKMLAASCGVLAAVSSDRQRLVLWHSWDGRKPFAEMHLTSQTRHRIADIDFA